MSYGWNHDYQYEQMEYGWNPQHQHEPSNEYEWSNEHRYYPSNEEMNYEEEYGYQQESFNTNLYCHDGYQPDSAPSQDDDLKQMLKQVLNEQRSLKKQFEEITAHLKEHDHQIAFHLMRLNAEGENEEVSDNEDMVQEIKVWDVLPKECNVADEHQEDCTQQSLYEEDKEITQFQDDESNEDVLHAQIPLMEEIEEISKDDDMTPEEEIEDVSPMDYEIVVEYKDDQIYTQQQSPAGEEVEEIIQLHENALDEDALASMVAVMNEKTLRYNNASTNETKKEEEKVVQIFELPQKELHQDEVVEPRVPGSPTPRSEYPQGPRKRLEWRIKHKWKIKLHSV